MAPPGQSEGHYVFRLDLTAGSLRFIRWNDFKNAEPAGERVLPELLESYPEVRPSGKTDPFAVAYPFRSGLRQDSDDRVRISIEPYRFAHDSGVPTPSLMRTTRSFPGTVSSGRNVRPSAGATRRVRNTSAVGEKRWDTLHTAFALQVEAHRPVRREALESITPFPPIEEIGK